MTSNLDIILSSISVVVIVSLATFAVLDSDMSISGAATVAQGTVSLTVTSATGCSLNTNNNSVTFGSVAPGATVSTSDVPNGTLVINNTGNTRLNISINSTNISTIGGGFFASSNTVSTDYQVKAGSLCSSNGQPDLAGIGTSYIQTSKNHRQLVASLNFSNGVDICDIDFQIEVPGDEPVGTKLDKININCTQTT